MAEIKFTGSKKLGTVSGEFWKSFPHLRLRFYPAEYKVSFDNGTASPFNNEEFLSKKVIEVRQKKGPDLIIHGNLKVKSLEKMFWDDHGILASVEFILADGTWCFTNAEADEYTLTEWNRIGESRGWLRDTNTPV